MITLSNLKWNKCGLMKLVILIENFFSPLSCSLENDIFSFPSFSSLFESNWVSAKIKWNAAPTKCLMNCVCVYGRWTRCLLIHCKRWNECSEHLFGAHSVNCQKSNRKSDKQHCTWLYECTNDDDDFFSGIFCRLFNKKFSPSLSRYVWVCIVSRGRSEFFSISLLYAF